MVVISLGTLTFLLLINHCGGRRRPRPNQTPHAEEIRKHAVWAEEIRDPCYVHSQNGHLTSTHRLKRDIEFEPDWDNFLVDFSSSQTTPYPLLKPTPFTATEPPTQPPIGFSSELKSSLINLKSLVSLVALFMVNLFVFRQVLKYRQEMFMLLDLHMD